MVLIGSRRQFNHCKLELIIDCVDNLHIIQEIICMFALHSRRVIRTVLTRKFFLFFSPADWGLVVCSGPNMPEVTHGSENIDTDSYLRNTHRSCSSPYFKPILWHSARLTDTALPDFRG